MPVDFTKAHTTIVLSDIHLADAEPPHPKNPLWKRFKRPKYFVDKSFKAFLENLHEAHPPGETGGVELVLNGDIFDFDSIMAMPEDESGFIINLLERLRGLNAEEGKSRFKMSVILKDHAVWFEALGDFIRKGHRVVLIIGNHDVELHWPSVRKDLVDGLKLSDAEREQIRFCEWFYISNGDTLIEHGNQYDGYSICHNPINPLIKKGSRIYVRIPFGNLAGKFMLNGMGLMNPHAESSYIKGSIREYLVFYYKYVIKTQPFLMVTWFWSALVTLIFSLSDGFLPALTDPLTIDSRVEDIASRANASPSIVWSLKEVHAHPAVFNPIKILRELWLDRAIMLGLVLFTSFQFFSTLNVFMSASLYWFAIPLTILLPLFIFYARSVESETLASQKAAFHFTPITAKIARVKRVIQGHTHLERHTWIEGVEYLNTGTWSPAYHDVECTQPYGRKCFARLRPGSPGMPRTAELLEWKDSVAEAVAPESSSAA